MVVIPFIDYPAFKQEIVIDEITYTFEFVWNYQGNFWSMTILKQDVPLVSGIKLVLHYELINIFCDRGLPDGGYLYVIDEAGNNAPIQYKDFVNDRRLQLIYVNEGELNVI